jgi:hypothetical protein
VQPSSKLISQLIPQRYCAEFLSRWCLVRNWEEKYNYSDLQVEFWATGLWINKAGLVSYKKLANFVAYTANMRSIGLNTKVLSQTITLVQGSQSPWYAVHRQPSGHLKCECMLYRMREARLPRETPILFKAMNRQIFCHHTAAVKQVEFL